MIISKWPQIWKVFSIMARRTITIWGPKRLRTPLPRDVEFTRLGFKAAVWWRNDVRPTTASWTPIRWKCATIVDGDVVRTKRLHSGKDIWNPFIAICRTAFERIEAGSKSPLPRQTIFQAIKPVQNRTESKSKLRRKWPLVIQSCKLTQNKGQNPKRPQWTQWNPRISLPIESLSVHISVWKFELMTITWTIRLSVYGQEKGYLKGKRLPVKRGIELGGMTQQRVSVWRRRALTTWPKAI